MDVELNKKDTKTKVNSFFGVLVAFTGIIGALWLLLDPKAISGSEFVALSLGFSVIGLIITFSAEVQEFSIAGNGVRLKELRSEAEKTIEELQLAKIELFRLLIPRVIDGSNKMIDLVDPRIKHFCKLFENIKKFDCVHNLNNEIEDGLNALMVAQYARLKFIHNVAKEKGDSFSNEEKPDFLYIKLNEEIISLYKANQRPIVDYDVKKNEIMDGIEAYGKLYAIKVKLDKLNLENA